MTIFAAARSWAATPIPIRKDENGMVNNGDAKPLHISRDLRARQHVRKDAVIEQDVSVEMTRFNIPPTWRVNAASEVMGK
jgi:hypothetical protein